MNTIFNTQFKQQRSMNQSGHFPPIMGKNHMALLLLQGNSDSEFFISGEWEVAVTQDTTI